MTLLGAFLKPFLGISAVVGALYFHQTVTVRIIPEEELNTYMEPAVKPRKTTLWFSIEGASVVLPLRPFGAVPWRGAPERGMLVWYDHPSFPGKMVISRVIGIPGDRIAIKGGKVFRDGKEFPEEYAAKLARDEAEEMLVPADHVYVLNDARRATGSPGADSRRLGPIPVGLIVGTSGDPEDATRGGGRKAKP